MRKKQYTARYTLERGNWLVEIVEIPQVHTFGRTLARARTHIRDALALWLRAEDPSILTIRDEIAFLPREVMHDIAEAARKLVDDLGMSIRDTAVLLKISHQRVHQLVRERNGDST